MKNLRQGLRSLTGKTQNHTPGLSWLTLSEEEVLSVVVRLLPGSGWSLRVIVLHSKWRSVHPSLHLYANESMYLHSIFPYSIWAQHFLQTCMCAQQRLSSARAVQSLLSVRRRFGSLSTHRVLDEDSYQTVRTHRLIRVFAERASSLGDAAPRFIQCKQKCTGLSPFFQRLFRRLQFLMTDLSVIPCWHTCFQVAPDFHYHWNVCPLKM